MNTLIDGFTAGGFDVHQAIIANAAQDLDHLPVAIIAALELAPDRGHRRRQDPVLERGTIAQCSGFACQNRHIVPGVIDRLATTEGTGMFADDCPVLPDDDLIGIGMHIDRSAHCSCEDGILVGVEAHGAGLGHRGGHTVEVVERVGIGHQARPFSLEHLPDRPVGRFGMAVRLRIGHAFVEQPAVQLFQAPDPQAGREEPLSDQPDLVLDLTFLPPRGRGAGNGINQEVAAHLQKAAVVVPLLAGEDRLDRRLRSAWPRTDGGQASLS